ncbi:hypothetical protein F4604DRAFT_1925773 [Suillus subluteus]|nr:hypothetical protein F4604DRAFT_1925773 [Suillus subluteus]
MSDSMSTNLAKLCVLIENLPNLCNSLPASVPEAMDSDLIHRITTTVTGENPWHTFNYHFNILFSEDCWDDQGHLCHLKRGPLGMDAVCTYLNSLNLDNPCFMHDLMVKKITCIVEEVIYLLSPPHGFTMTAHVADFEDLPESAPKTRPESIALLPAKGKKKQVQKPNMNDDMDQDYVARKPRDVLESPIHPYIVDEDGNEILNELDDELPGRTKKWAHASKLTTTDSDSDASNTAITTTAVVSKKTSKNQAKGGPKKKKSKKTHTTSTKQPKMTTSAKTINIDVSSENESDGQGAL